MFCPKCGAKAPDDAGFCQKCGAKLNPGDAAKPTVESPAIPTKQADGVSGEASKKRKKKKLPIIIGAIVLLVVILVIASSGGGSGGRDNIATVQAHKPFATSQNLPYTFAEVFDKYMNNLVWYTDSEDKETGTAIVKVDGTVKGTEYRLIVSIEVSPNPNDPDGCLIRPQSVVLDGSESPNQNEAVGFLYNMFAAYDEGYSDLSDLLSDPGIPGQQGDIELTETYTNAEMGISFQYPQNWDLTEISGSDVSLTNSMDEIMNGHRAAFNVSGERDPFGIFNGDTASIESAVNQSAGNITFLSLEDVTIDEVSARFLRYRSEGQNGVEPSIARAYYYVNGDKIYEIVCSCNESIVDTYGTVFDAIIGSYTITPVEGTAPSQGIDETEPSQDDQLPTATTGFVGSWQEASGAYQMEISDADSDGIYTIEITQNLNDGEWRQWYLEGAYEQDFGIFCWGTYVEQYLRDDGTVGLNDMADDVDDVIYFGDDGLLHWNDSVLGLPEIRFVRQ